MTFTTSTLSITNEERKAVPSISIQGGNVTIALQTTLLSRAYQLQYSDSLASGSWINDGPILVGDGNTLEITRALTPSASRRFYRIAIIEAP
jgi:hypothetical protein